MELESRELRSEKTAARWLATTALVGQMVEHELAEEPRQDVAAAVMAVEGAELQSKDDGGLG